MPEPNSDPPKITRLPRNGPKPGQTMASYLGGRARGDRQWNTIRERNFARLMQPRRKPKPPSP